MDMPSIGGCSSLSPNHRVQRRETTICAIARHALFWECTIWLLKGQWHFLDSTDGKLLKRPEKVCEIVRVCTVLHNVAWVKNVALCPHAVGCVGQQHSLHPPHAANLKPFWHL